VTDLVKCPGNLFIFLPVSIPYNVIRSLVQDETCYKDSQSIFIGRTEDALQCPFNTPSWLQRTHTCCERLVKTRGKPDVVWDFPKYEARY
jgi:hypothetical protein